MSFSRSKKYSKGGGELINSTPGFTLLETLVAISILMLGVAGPMALAAQSLQALSPERNRLIATFLAQEAVELIRNVRDSNVSASVPWDSGFCFAGGGGYPCEREIACDKNSCHVADSVFNSYSGNPLKLSSDGYYNYHNGASGGPETLFKRKITFIKPNNLGVDPLLNQVEYDISITWQERFGPREYKLVGYLTDWR